MTQKNRYFRRSKISEARFRALVRCFALDLTATTTAHFTGLSVRSVNSIFLRIRRRIAEHCERQSPFSGEVEVDESFFGPWRVRGKRGRGAYKKTIVFGMLKRGGCATIIGMMKPGTKLEIDPFQLLQARRIQGSIMGSNRFPVDLPALTDFYMQGRLKLDEMISQRIKLEDINVAFDEMRRGELARSVIVFDQ